MKTKNKFKLINTEFYWNSEIKNNKVHEFQLFWNFNVMLMLIFSLSPTDNEINIFNLISLSTRYSTKCDHAGFSIDMTILGYNILYSWYDTRHWDYENDQWKVYD